MKYSLQELRSIFHKDFKEKYIGDDFYEIELAKLIWIMYFPNTDEFYLQDYILCKDTKISENEVHKTIKMHMKMKAFQ